MAFWKRIRDYGPWSRAQREHDLEREIQNHLDTEREELGEFEARWMRFEELRSDIQYGLRQVRSNPTFSAIAIATLALGIGGITAMFSAFDAVLIRPLPYAGADRLLMIWDEMSKPDVTTKHMATPAEWIEWRRLNTVFTDLATTQPADAALSGAVRQLHADLA